MKQAAFKRTDRKINPEAATSFVNNSPNELPSESKKEDLIINKIKIEKIDMKENDKEDVEKEAKKEFLLRMPADLHKKLKIKAVEEEINMGDMILEAVEKVYFKN